MTRGDFNGQADGGWWLDKQEWACTANDAVENGVNTGWKTPNGDYVSTNGNENGQMVATSERGVRAGDADSTHGILEVTESAFVNLNFETDGTPLNAQVGVRYEEITRTSSSIATVPEYCLGFGDWFQHPVIQIRRTWIS